MFNKGLNMIILKFNDFSIGKKLFSGFILLICIIIGISGYGIYALKTIEHNSIKTTLTNDIGNQLDAARQNRLIYMHTGDDEKMKANGDAIKSMQTLIKDASQFTWRGEAQKQFEQLSANIEL